MGSGRRGHEISVEENGSVVNRKEKKKARPKSGRRSIQTQNTEISKRKTVLLRTNKKQTRK